MAIVETQSGSDALFRFSAGAAERAKEHGEETLHSRHTGFLKEGSSHENA